MRILVLFILLISGSIYAQVLPGVPVAGIPSGTTAQINAIPTPPEGLMAYSTDDNTIYYYNGTAWVTFASTNIYEGNGTLAGERTMTMGTNQLNFDTDADSRTTLTLRRTNNGNQVGLAFRNSGNAYPASIVMGTSSNGNNNGLDFYVGGNQNDPNLLTKTLALQNTNQIQFSQYGSDTFLNNSPFRFLGVEADGDVVEVNPTALGTDDQRADEVPLLTNVDVNEGENSTPTLETTVEEVIQAIAPITSKAGRVFYPPSIAIDASSIQSNQTIDLYAQYTAQFATPVARNPAAPATIPIYAANELNYYVTFADSTIFNIDSISDAGVLQYDILAVPTDDNTIINVVFVVK